MVVASNVLTFVTDGVVICSKDVTYQLLQGFKHKVGKLDFVLVKFFYFTATEQLTFDP